MEDFQEPCQYSQESQKFSCQLAVPEGDNSFYVVSLCVANSAGSKSSRTQTFDGYGICKLFQDSLCTFQLFPSWASRRGKEGLGEGLGELGPLGLYLTEV